jgi:hypothetical protein
MAEPREYERRGTRKTVRPALLFGAILFSFFVSHFDFSISDDLQDAQERGEKVLDDSSSFLEPHATLAIV